MISWLITFHCSLNSQYIKHNVYKGERDKDRKEREGDFSHLYFQPYAKIPSSSSFYTKLTVSPLEKDDKIARIYHSPPISYLSLVLIHPYTEQSH